MLTSKTWPHTLENINPACSKVWRDHCRSESQGLCEAKGQDQRSNWTFEPMLQTCQKKEQTPWVGLSWGPVVFSLPETWVMGHWQPARLDHTWWLRMLGRQPTSLRVLQGAILSVRRVSYACDCMCLSVLVYGHPPKDSESGIHRCWCSCRWTSLMFLVDRTLKIYRHVSSTNVKVRFDQQALPSASPPTLGSECASGWSWSSGGIHSSLVYRLQQSGDASHALLDIKPAELVSQTWDFWFQCLNMCKTFFTFVQPSNQ